MPDMLLLGSHPEVITAGRGGQAENLLNPQVPVIETERGGDVTYHGPGQLIAYPIIKLAPNERDLHAYLRKLEEVQILTLRDFGLWGIRHKGYTGVWVLDQTVESETSEKVIRRPRKIASIGVAVKQWVTYHGIALNIAPRLDRFAQINPCGLAANVMTSMAEQLDRPLESPQALASVRQTFETRFARVFGYQQLPQKSASLLPQG